MNGRFMPRIRSGKAPHFYYDEVYDFLESEDDGRPLHPHRLRGAATKKRKEFRKTAKKSFALQPSPSGGEFVLLHVRLPGHHNNRAGKKRTKYGTRIVPRRDHVESIVLMVS